MAAVIQDEKITKYKARSICEVIISSMNAYRRKFTKNPQPIAKENTTNSGETKYQFQVAVNSYSSLSLASSGKQIKLELELLLTKSYRTFIINPHALQHCNLTYHHILEKRRGGKRTLQNGAILMRVAHDYLNYLDRYYLMSEEQKKIGTEIFYTRI